MASRFSRRAMLSAAGAGALGTVIRADDFNIPDKYATQRPPPPGTDYDGPLYLSDLVTLQPGQTISADDNALGNNTEGPIAIDGIDFAIRRQLYGGGIVHVQLSLGEIPITAGPVPIWLLGKALPVYFGDGLQGASLGADAGTFCHRWDFARPLVVPAGAALTATFTHTGLLQTSMTVLVGYRARTLPNVRGLKLGKTLEVPYACAYLAPANVTDASGATFQSDPNALRAPPDAMGDLDIQRFTGRYFASFTTTNGLGTTIPFIDEVATDAAPSGVASYDAQIQIMSSWDAAQVVRATKTPNGTSLVQQSGAPFRLVFDRHTRSWECPHSIPPGAYYRVRGAYPVAAFTATPPVFVASQVQVGLNGSRKVQLSKGKVL